MSLDMYGQIDDVFESTPVGGVTLTTPAAGDYSGPGGTWVEASAPVTTPLQFVNIQPADLKTVRLVKEIGGTAQLSDLRVVRINDGTMIEPDDEGTFAQLLNFEGKQWRVIKSDNRPWRNYCKVIVEQYRGAR